MKLGGNYTQPVHDPATDEVYYEIYVGWVKIGMYESDAEATYHLQKALEERPTVHVG